MLVVGFSIIALSASKMGQLFSASSTAAAMGTILDLYTATRSIRSAQGYGNDELIIPLIKAKMIPKGLVVVDDVAYNEWKGPIGIKGVDDGTDIGFDITYPQVPGDACSQITQNLLHSGNFMEIRVGTFPAKPTSSVAEVVGACATSDAPASGETSGTKGVTMVFAFRE